MIYRTTAPISTQAHQYGRTPWSSGIPSAVEPLPLVELLMASPRNSKAKRISVPTTTYTRPLTYLLSMMNLSLNLNMDSTVEYDGEYGDLPLLTKRPGERLGTQETPGRIQMLQVGAQQRRWQHAT